MFAPRLIILQPTPYCNIACSYCYLGHRDDRTLMSRDVVEAIRDKIFARLPSEVAPTVVWHAGEPLTAPIRWYEHAYERLAGACPPHTIFAVQTNGIAVDERWAEFFLRTRTEVGVSIDGPQRFHDARRRTRNGGPTWRLAVRGLKRMQDAGLSPRIITVLHRDGLGYAEEYYRFYRDHGVTHVSFSIDEQEGANRVSSFDGASDKARISDFLLKLLECAYRDEYPLHIREVERIGQVLAGGAPGWNEQVEPWATIVIAADGKVSSFSPELMELQAPAYGDFAFGNILDGDLDSFNTSDAFVRASRDVAAGVAACRERCRYFAVCGGGAPANKYSEAGDLRIAETEFCRLSVQTAADALMTFVATMARRSKVERMASGLARTNRAEPTGGAP